MHGYHVFTDTEGSSLVELASRNRLSVRTELRQDDPVRSTPEF